MSLNTANTPHPLPPHKGEGSASSTACPHIAPSPWWGRPGCMAAAFASRVGYTVGHPSALVAPSPSWGGPGWGAAARRVSRSVHRPSTTNPAIRRADPKHTPAILRIWQNSETHP